MIGIRIVTGFVALRTSGNRLIFPAFLALRNSSVITSGWASHHSASSFLGFEFRKFYSLALFSSIDLAVFWVHRIRGEEPNTAFALGDNEWQESTGVDLSQAQLMQAR